MTDFFLSLKGKPGATYENDKMLMSRIIFLKFLERKRKKQGE